MFFDVIQMESDKIIASFLYLRCRVTAKQRAREKNDEFKEFKRNLHG